MKIFPSVIAFMLCLSAFGQEPLKTGQNVIVSLSGVVEVAESGQSVWKRAWPNQPLKSGDLIRTGRNGRAAVRLATANILRLPESTTFAIPEQKAANH